MKCRITITLLIILIVSTGVFAQTATCDGTLPFEEQNGLLTIEMESGILPSGSNWQTGSESDPNLPGSTINYIYWTGPESFNALSGAPIVYKIKINNPGTYRFAWRMRVGMGTNTGEHNDAWLKIDGEDFYGIKNGVKVYPKPLCNSDPNLTCAAGSSTQNFIKAFGNRLDWGFVTNTNDGDSHRVWVTFNEAKEYTITVDARSSYLFIDKMVLHRSNVSGSVAFNFSNSESSCYSALSTTKNELDQIKVYPNPTKDFINFDNLPVKSNLVISNVHGAIVKTIETISKRLTINISDLTSGIYFISSVGTNFTFTQKIIKI
ncbi:T9SS type A sorting domain-containing protein [Seonamhaeicola maritimus]|uniref:T9SS type A sorting domain-containing protein n=1 Tax=Seonamhaeicola maritimus TaxID=2591822 RepID=A0A5C7GMJ5_9FLAO|nr:T9SS type A sorting domain-containing protein [Seonamhaeicola maritimus]TXG39514.1 T9SS type A sorting domain-containing protein [Seonamhaeicola maritimus]